MSIYKKVAKALVYDLINEANPTLAKPVSNSTPYWVFRRLSLVPCSLLPTLPSR